MAHDHGHENAKQIEALAELIRRFSVAAGTPLTHEQTTIAARAVTSEFDLAGKGALLPFKQWVIKVYEAGPYMNIGGSGDQAENCAGEICC